MCEKQKMLNGEIYNAYDKDLVLLRNKARHLTKYIIILTLRKQPKE